MAATVAAPLERRLGEIAGRRPRSPRPARSAAPASPSSSTSSREHRRRRARRAGRAQRRADRPAGRPADAARLRKVNPSASPVLILALTSKTHDAERALRRRPTPSRPAHLAGRRRRRGQRQRRRAAGDPRPGRSRSRSPPWASSWRTCAPPSPTPTRSSPLGTSTGRTRADAIGTNDQLRDAARVRAASWSRPATARWSACRPSPSIEQGVRNSRSAAWFNRQPSVLLVDHQAGRRQRHRDRRPHPRAAAGAQALDAGGRRRFPSCPTAPRPSAPASHDMQWTLAATIGLVMLVVFLFLRRIAADHRGRRHGAAVAGRHLRGDVGGRLFDRQHLADGARGLGRLRRRRRDRDDRERLPQPRNGHDAAARRDRGRAADRLHRHLDQRCRCSRPSSPLLFMGGVVGRHVPRILADAALRHRASRRWCR